MILFFFDLFPETLFHDQMWYRHYGALGCRIGHLGHAKTTVIVNCSSGASLGRCARPILDWYDFVLQLVMLITFLLLFECVETKHCIRFTQRPFMRDLKCFLKNPVIVKWVLYLAPYDLWTRTGSTPFKPFFCSERQPLCSSNNV